MILSAISWAHWLTRNEAVEATGATKTTVGGRKGSGAVSIKASTDL